MENKGYKKEFLLRWYKDIKRNADDKYDFIVVNMSLKSYLSLSLKNRIINRIKKYIHIIKWKIRIKYQILYER